MLRPPGSGGRNPACHIICIAGMGLTASANLRASRFIPYQCVNRILLDRRAEYGSRKAVDLRQAPFEILGMPRVDARSIRIPV